ncbi:MAG: hypothetical protein LLF76_00265 [Planctomycetaceae bacterium]|nr:hypothetical protein [Planctomycetaceae bacterium]
MRHINYCIILALLLTGTLVAATDLETLAQKCPAGTVGFIATSGTEEFGPEFEASILGQIAGDAQVKSFFEQLIASVGKISPEFNGEKAKAYIDFAKQVLRSPTIAAMRVDPENPSADPMLILMSKTVTDKTEFSAALENMLKPWLESKKMQKQSIKGSTVYTSADSNDCEFAYLAQAGDLFLAVVNDKELTMLADGSPNVELAGILKEVPDSQDAFIGYVDIQQILALVQKESGQDYETAKAVLQSLGLSDLRYGLVHGGFEGSSVAAQSRLQVSTGQGLWKAFSPADRSLFNSVDPNAMQAGVAHIAPEVLYDTILNAIPQTDPNAGGVGAKIAEAEAMLDFKIRDDLLANLEGTFMGYALAPTPDLLGGGYVVTARLKDAKKVETCLLYLGNVIASHGKEQVQVTSQQTADGKQIHIWAVGPIAMVQIIPSWTIEGDTLIFTTHPSLTKNVMTRLAAGQQGSIVSDPRFAALLKTVPQDAFAIGLSDSQANARQLMRGLQQVWPMLNMGLMQQGIQLPIMLPSIDTYIERMEPGVRYLRKTADGIEGYYKGSGLEVSTGGVAGTAMAAAILMPALAKTKQIAQRVVSGTNLKGIGTASIVYAADHEGRFPSSFEDLVREADVSSKTLESPRKPKGFDGPDYILVPGLTDNAAAEMVLAYENPGFIRDDQVNVLYADGHVAVESKATLKENLQKTYEYLGKPIPEIDWGSK